MDTSEFVVQMPDRKPLQTLQDTCTVYTMSDNRFDDRRLFVLLKSLLSAFKLFLDAWNS